MRVTELLGENWSKRMSPGDRDEWSSKQGFGKRDSLAYQLDGGANDEDHDRDEIFLKAQRDKDRGPWFLRINGKILKSQGEPKVFDWKKGANNYALAILKNKPELQGKIMLTRRPQDDETVVEIASSGATTAGNMSVGAVHKNQSPKMQKPTDNALDGDDLMTGGSIKR